MATLGTRYWKVAILWGVSLLVVSAISSSAQPQTDPGQPGFNPNRITVTPELVFGNDVGFRIVRTQDGIPIGKIVVRIDGRWVETGTDAR
jgi:hypothetical protein